MVDKSKYTIKYQKKTLRESYNSQGDLIASEYKSNKVMQKNLVETSGMTLMKKKDIFTKLETIVKSNTDMRIISYMIRKQGLGGYVVDDRSKPIGINDIAEKFDVTRRKVSSLIGSMVDTGMIKKNKRKLQLNPYYAIPNNSSSENSFYLQLDWKHDFKYTREELFNIHSEDFAMEELKEV